MFADGGMLVGNLQELSDTQVNNMKSLFAMV